MAAAVDALRRFGTLNNGSRFPERLRSRMHVQLEERLGKFTGKEAAPGLSTGYLTNSEHLGAHGQGRRGDTMTRTRTPASLDGARLSRPTSKRFQAQRYFGDLERLLGHHIFPRKRGS